MYWIGVFHIFRARPTGRWSSSDRKIRQRRIIGRRYYAFRCFAAIRYSARPPPPRFFPSSAPRLLRFTLESASLRHATRPTHERDPVARIERDDRIRIGTTSSRVESRLLSTIDSRGKGGRERADAICEMRRLIIQAFTATPK